MLKGIAWDLDGTLVQFQLDYKRARNAARAIYETNGLPKGLLTENHLIIQMTQIASDYFEKEAQFPQTEIIRIKKAVDDAVIEVEADAAQMAIPMKGITSVLLFSQKNRIKAGILTYNTKPNTILSLERAGILDYFPDHELIMGRDCVKHPKPHPDHIRCLLEVMKLTPAEICVIGDHPRDIEAANNVQARSIAIISRDHRADEFKTEYTCDEHEIANTLPRILAEFMK